MPVHPRLRTRQDASANNRSTTTAIGTRPTRRAAGRSRRRKPGPAIRIDRCPRRERWTARSAESLNSSSQRSGACRGALLQWARGISMSDVILGPLRDLRLAWRMLRATPVVTLVAIASLALGIGANTAIFSVLDSLLLRTLPVRDPARLVLLTDTSPGHVRVWSYAVWSDINRRPQIFDRSAAWSFARFNLASGGETRPVEGMWASGSFFDTLGVAAVLGRTFSDADDRRGGGANGPVAVISYGFWQRRFGGAADVLGRSLMVDDVPFTIVGVMPVDFTGPEIGRSFDVIVPVGCEPLMRGRDSFLDDSGVTFLTIVARLRADRTLDHSTAELRAVQPQIRE